MTPVFRTILLPSMAAALLSLAACGDSGETTKKAEKPQQPPSNTQRAPNNAQPNTTRPQRPAPQPATAPAQNALAKGNFTGLSGHRTSGLVTLVRTGNGVEVRLSSDFNFDGAPDPWLGFGKGGKYDTATTFTKLRQNTGAQVYTVPSNIDPSKYDEVYVWCKRFAVSLAVARLK